MNHQPNKLSDRQLIEPGKAYGGLPLPPIIKLNDNKGYNKELKLIARNLSAVGEAKQDIKNILQRIYKLKNMRQWDKDAIGARDGGESKSQFVPENACDVGGLHERLLSGGSYDYLLRCDRILYNRVPKCGSRTILSTFSHLATSLNFTMLSMPKWGPHNYFTDIKDLVREYIG